ncbi:MAG: U32 family peptidase [Bacteroidales bacterium]|nr:U32 family peptidase [Bacteroidales bacterium]
MAPVGSWESLQAAVQAKADSVYFGIDKLNMRSQSTVNFTFDDLNKITKICRDKGIKTYLTVNSVIYDQDIPVMKEIVDAAKLYNVDAVIASDIAAIQYARSSGVEVHISTQLNVSNIEAVRFFAQFADVIVLARELNLIQVAQISKVIENENICGPSGKPVRLEMFVHGALCMAISGKCYLSLHEYNKSANKGSCLQLCRRSYKVTDKETGNELEIDNQYIMSPKDLCTIDFFNLLMDAGLKVFKIEGRARSAEYVKTVTECYREALESCLEGTYSTEKAVRWKSRLATVFNRGFWDGYYLGKRLGEWSKAYGSAATKKKVYLAKGMNYFSNLKVAEFLNETGNLRVGDEIIIIGPTTGVIETTVKEIRVELSSVDETQKGERFSIPLEQAIRRSDKLYKIIETP